MHWGWPHHPGGPQPGSEKKKAEIPQRQKHQTLPTHPQPSLGISQWTLLPQLSLQGQGLPRARGRGLPPGSGEEEPYIKFVWAPMGGIPWILPVGGSGCEGEGSAQRGLGPGGTQGEPFSGGTGRQSKGRLRGCRRPPGGPVGRTAAAGKDLRLRGSRGGWLSQAAPGRACSSCSFLRLGPPQVGQGPASLEGGQESLQALLPQQQLLHLLLGQEGRDSLGGP